VTALLKFSPGGCWLAIRHREELGIWDTTAGEKEPLAFLAKPWVSNTRLSFSKMAFAPGDALVWQDTEALVATALPSGAELARWTGEDGGLLRGEVLPFEPEGKFFAFALSTPPALELRSWPDGKVQEVWSGRFPQVLSAIALIAGRRRAGELSLPPTLQRAGRVQRPGSHRGRCRQCDALRCWRGKQHSAFSVGSMGLGCTDCE
jgi:hypothetical protein